MTSLTFYGGVNEIGGNKFLLSSREGNYFLDFGLSFIRMKRFFAEFVQPRSVKGVKDYLKMGLSPSIKGLYRKDLIKPVSSKIFKETKRINGILLSHPHLDHCGLVFLANLKIPVFCHPTCKKIMDISTETGRGMEKELSVAKIREYGEYQSGKYPTSKREFMKFDEASIEVESYPVDHSTYGCCGLIIYTPSATIAYTGDLRLHGLRSSATEKFIERLKEADIDIFLVDGTRVDESRDLEILQMLAGKMCKRLESEQEVKEKCIKLVSDVDKPVFLDFAKRDFDRFLTFYKVAKETGRKLVIPIDLAFYIDKLSEELGIDFLDENLLIYLHEKKTGGYYPKQYYKWERNYVSSSNARNFDFIRERMKKLLIFMDFWHIQRLIDLDPKEGYYIHSSSEPFDEESAIDFRKLKEWLKSFGLEYKYMHASGHLTQKEVFDLCRRVKAKKVIPIHTVGAKLFRKKLDNVVLPKMHQTISF